MAVSFSQQILSSKKPHNRKSCRECGLYLNQCPAFDRPEDPQVFWVGLSAVQFDEDDAKVPLAAETRSGALLDQIEKPLRKDFSFYKTNLVKCLPLRENKIRYPSKSEMTKCSSNFDMELLTLMPDVVFLLGKQVANFVLSKYSDHKVEFATDFKYKTYLINGITFVPVHHPSYILVYRRKRIDEYRRNIRKIIRRTVNLGIAICD